ncbi:MAG: LysE family transporter [Alphaproteobacteria bacterium]|nr:LysE family transporter [Alphaproteobacteria bacterium]
MTWDSFGLYLIAAIGLSLTPGPNGLLALTHGTRYGVRATTATILGGGLGFLVLIALSLAGMGALLAASHTLFTVVKWVGGLYLVWLGIQLWRAPPMAATLLIDPTIETIKASKLFRQGFLVAVSNPKGLIFFSAFLPQFMSPEAGFLTQLAVFGGTFVCVEILYEVMLAATARRIAPVLSRHGRWFNRTTGATFIGMGAILATGSRTS